MACVVFWPLALGQKQGGGYHPWVWVIAIPWWILLAFAAIGYATSKNKPKPSQGKQSAIRIPPNNGRVMNGKVNHDKAYADLSDALLSNLSTVETVESAGAFVVQAVQQVRAQAAHIPEFYIGEFLNLFKDSVSRQARADIAACEQAREAATAEADAATAELQADLDAARAAGDREAEHDVWRQREERQAAVQAKIDASAKRARSVSLRLDTCKNLASALGVPFK